MKMISLGTKNNYDSKCAPTKEEMPEMNYPTLYIDTKEDLGIPELGKEFTVVIKACKKSASKSKAEGEEAKYSCTIDVLEMGEPKCCDGSDMDEDMGRKIKNAMRKKLGKMMESDGDY